MLTLIKSFNRPWMLDRCLYSLSNVSGVSKVVVVDDGTEDKFLKIILKKHPNIILITDPKNNGKVAHIRKNDMPPVDLWKGVDPNKQWVQAVKKYAKDYFFLHEDDVYTPIKWDLTDLIKEMRQNKISYCDISGKFGRSVRVDKILKQCNNFDIVANSRKWSWFAAAFCIYTSPMFTYLYGEGLKGKLQDGNHLANRAKDFYAKNPKYKGASIRGPARVIISDHIASRKGHLGAFKTQTLNDALNNAWANGSFNWKDYYPDLVPFEKLLSIFKEAKLEDRIIKDFVRWRKKRTKDYNMPYDLDGKVRWDNT